MFLKERVAQYMHKITLYILGKLHLSVLIKLELQQKRCRHVCKSQNVCPNEFALAIAKILTFQHQRMTICMTALGTPRESPFGASSRELHALLVNRLK